MSPDRIPSDFNDPIISERLLLLTMLKSDQVFPQASCIGERTIVNECGEKEVGKYRRVDDKRCVTTDWKIISSCIDEGRPIPTFLVAGPRQHLAHNPKRVRAAIVTTGGSAPGLNCVIHSIVKRHHETYQLNQGSIFGVQDSFLGMAEFHHYKKKLKPDETEGWIEKGGSMLGMRRYRGSQDELSRTELAEIVLAQLQQNRIDILYVLGGDGSLSIAHEIAKKALAALDGGGRRISVVGIPKTMDNDVMWAESFGFKTAVERATEIINTLNSEAETSRRVCLIELFGAESGYVAAHATLASGHVDLVLVPEEFLGLSKEQCEEVLRNYIDNLRERVSLPPDDKKSHAIVILAEGTAKILKKRGVEIDGNAVDDFLVQLKEHLRTQDLTDAGGNEIDVFFNRPRHYIRASPANAQDKIYCEQLGALAVDSALAGYTDVMVSQWLSSYVLVPLELVADRHKRIPTSTLFWKQVVNSTGQPSVECHDADQDGSDM